MTTTRSLAIAKGALTALLLAPSASGQTQSFAFSGYSQSSEFPLGEMYTHKVSTFTGRMTYRTGPNDGGCTKTSGIYERVAALYPDSLSVTVKFVDGRQFPLTLPVGTTSSFGPATLALKTYCNGTTAIGHTSLEAFSVQSIQMLRMAFDDASAPVVKPPFTGTFTQTSRFRPSVFYFNVPEESALYATEEVFGMSALVTCLAPLSSPTADPALSACGSPAPVARIPDPRVYVYSGVAEDISGFPSNKQPGAKFLGKFTLDSSLLFNQPNSFCVPDEIGGPEQNLSYTMGAGHVSGIDILRVFLPDGRQGSLTAAFQGSPTTGGQAITGFCLRGDNGSSKAVGTTRLILSGYSSIVIEFDDAPPAAVAVANPFNGILPQVSKFKSSTALFQGFIYDPIELFSAATPLSGRITCLAQLARPDDDIMTSSCASGFPAWQRPEPPEQYSVSVFAGKGVSGNTGDGGPALEAAFTSPSGVAWRDGGLYVSSGDAIRKVDAGGAVSTIAGGNSPGNSGDGGPAVNAQLGFAGHLTFGPDGSLYAADRLYHVIRKISPDGTISTVAGSGTQGSSDDGAIAAGAPLSLPSSLAFDGQGLLNFVEGKHLRQLASDGTLKTIPAGAARSPEAAAADSQGNLLIEGSGKMVRVSADGRVVTVVGGPTRDYTGDGDLALKSDIGSTGAIATDDSGNIYFAQDGLFLRKINAAGKIYTIAGVIGGAISGAGVSPGIGSVRLVDAVALAADSAGRLYVAEQGANRVLVLTPRAPVAP